MKKNILGKIGPETSEICLGCMNFGSRIDEDTSLTLLDYFIEKGGNFLDTANNYAFWIKNFIGGESEKLLGRWMKKKRNRKQIILATKCGANPTDIEKVKDEEGNIKQDWGKYREGLSEKSIINAVDESLKRLQTDYIDLYYAHIDDRQTPIEETLEAFYKIIKAGKVRYIGCSNYRTWRIERAKNISHFNQWPEFCCVQEQYSYIRPNPGADFGIGVYADPGLLDYCQNENNLTIVAYSPLLSGLYTKVDSREKNWVWSKFKGPDTEKRLNTLKEVANKVGASENQIVFAWMLQGAPRILPIIGTSNIDQLKENLGALDIILDPDLIKLLDSASA